MSEVRQSSGKISVETAKLILDQAEKKMVSTIETANQISDRAVNVMQLTIPMSIALTGLIIADPTGPLLLPYVIVLGLSVATSWLALHVYDSYDIARPGVFPKQMLSDEVVGSKASKRQLIMLLQVIEGLEIAIAANVRSNYYRQKACFYTLGLLKALILCSVFLFSMGLLNLYVHK